MAGGPSAIDSLHSVSRATGFVPMYTDRGFLGFVPPTTLWEQASHLWDSRILSRSPAASPWLPCINVAASSLQSSQQTASAGAGGGGGSPPKSDGWWRSNGGGGGWSRRTKLLAAAILIFLSLLVADRLAVRESAVVGGSLVWSEEVVEHLAELAVEWDTKSASTYLTCIARASTPQELTAAIDQVLLAEDIDATKAGSGDAGDPVAMLLAAAVGCVAMSDMKCRALLPLIVEHKAQQGYWATRADPHWRLALETLSLPLGPEFAARFPQRALEHRIHDCRVLEFSAAAAAATGAEVLGRLHHGLELMAASHDKVTLQQAVCHNTALLEAICRPGPALQPGQRLGSRDWDIDPARTTPTSSSAMLMAVRNAANHGALEGVGGAGTDVVTAVSQLGGGARGRWRRRREEALRRWPEAAAILALASVSPVRAAVAQPGQLYSTITRNAGVMASGVAKVFRENLQGPMERIGAALFEKPAAVPMSESAQASRDVLTQMITAFNRDVSGNRRAGMSGVMAAYEEEVRTPIRSALSGRLLRAGLIQVQEIKVNFETEMATVQRLLEAQQLNLQAVAMLPALGLSWVSYKVLSCVAMVPFTSDPLRPQLDIESLLHIIGRDIIGERTALPLSSAGFQRRGDRCLRAWQATQVLKAKRVGNIMGTSREAAQLRADVARLASPQMSPEHIPLLLDVVFRQLRR